MNKVNKVICGLTGFFMLLGASALTANAEEISAAHLKAAKETLLASKATLPFDGILPSISERIKTGLIQTRPDLSDDISQTTDALAIEMAARRSDLETESARVYANVFSEDELNQITAFYNSEAGQKLINEAPILARELSKASQVWGNGIYRDLSAAVRNKLKDKGL